MSEVIALFEGRTPAKGAWEDLHDLGFPRETIGMLERDQRGEEAVADRRTAGAAQATAVLTADTVAVVPGIGPVIARGALASAAEALEAGSARNGVLSAISGSGNGGRAETATYYRECLEHGGVIVTVEAAGDRLEEAKRIVSLNGAIILDVYEEGWRA